MFYPRGKDDRCGGWGASGMGQGRHGLTAPAGGGVKVSGTSLRMAPTPWDPWVCPHLELSPV